MASVYDQYYANPDALRYRYQVYDRVLRDFSLQGNHVLDAMCGGGEATGYFLERGCQVAGLDISDEQCRVYAERYPQNLIVCGSIFDTSFPDNSFDLVVTDSLHHTQPRTSEAMAEILRILRPGGYLLAYEPNADSFIDQFRRLWYRLDPNYFEENEQSISIEHLAGAVPQFHLVDAIYGGNIAYLLVQEAMIFRIPTPIIPYYAPLLMQIEALLDRLNLSRFFSCWVLALIQKT